MTPPHPPNGNRPLPGPPQNGWPPPGPQSPPSWQQQNWQQQPPPSAQQPRRTSKAPLIISVAAGAVLVLLLGLGMFAFRGGGGTEAAGEERGGERFLQLTPGGPAARYGATPAYDACATVPPAVLEQIGLKLALDRQLEHSYAKDDELPERAIEDSEMSGCDYLIDSTASPTDLVSLKVYQQPRSSETELELVAESPASQDVPVSTSTDRGFQVGYWQDPDQRGGWRATVARPDVAVDVLITLSDPEYGGRPVDQVVGELTTRIVDGLAAGPAALDISYTGRYADTPNPCDVLNGAALEASFPVQASNWVRDYYLPGELRMAEADGYRVDTGCTRTAAVDGDIFGPDPDSISADFMNWEDVEVGRKYVANKCDHPILGKPPVRTEVQIGDGTTCLTDLNGDWRLEFQSGRTTVTLGSSSASQDPQEVARMLEPAAREVIRNLG
ncbi:hypothetical protein OOZ19_23520 [Saccharopolyspora sp. NFXS83]|uniref:hypothetical protein n=1 Tax=Saccharopolyspora sp. NFXS83 TaxID=2993560 RepID=UPI00224A4A54|nr:hypothetical protein [Saccharopolyspora sp. NFXS83]MCX2733222.1 hypothetical protein [Saccharopolyspora sp. NFXS83]